MLRFWVFSSGDIWNGTTLPAAVYTNKNSKNFSIDFETSRGGNEGFFLVNIRNFSENFDTSGPYLEFFAKKMASVFFFSEPGISNGINLQLLHSSSYLPPIEMTV